jgi:hypothetical protein
MPDPEKEKDEEAAKKWINNNLEFMRINPDKKCLCPKCTSVVFEGTAKFCPHDGVKLISFVNKCSYLLCNGKLEFPDKNCKKCGRPASWNWEGWKYPWYSH